MTFDPNSHLMDLSGKDYLEVKWRLVWFREECPDGTIDTEEVCVDLDREVEAEVPTGNWIPNPNRPGKKMPEKVIKTARGYARFRAVVTDGKGGRATGTKTENAASFPDFIEKAETGAVGRALAMLGYGTQFTGDEMNEQHRVVDAPVEHTSLNGHTSSNGHQPTTTQSAQNGSTARKEALPPAPKAAPAAASTPAPAVPPQPDPLEALRQQTLAEITGAGAHGPYELRALCTFAHVASDNPKSWTEDHCASLHNVLATWMDLDREELGHKAWMTRLTSTDVMHAELERLHNQYKTKHGSLAQGGLAQQLLYDWGYPTKTKLRSLPRAIIDQMLLIMRAATAAEEFRPEDFLVPGAYAGFVKANREARDTVTV